MWQFLMPETLRSRSFQQISFQKCGALSGVLSLGCVVHTVEYDPFIKSRLASRNSLEGVVVQIWSRNTLE